MQTRRDLITGEKAEVLDRYKEMVLAAIEIPSKEAAQPDTINALTKQGMGIGIEIAKIFMGSNLPNPEIVIAGISAKEMLPIRQAAIKTIPEDFDPKVRNYMEAEVNILTKAIQDYEDWLNTPVE